MANHQQHQGHKQSEKLFKLFWVLWVALLIGVSYSSVHDSIQATMSDPVFFRLREKLHRTPDLSPRLKIFGLDDNTIAFLGGSDVSTEDFALLLANIMRQKPKAILLDRIFTTAPKEKDYKKFIDQLRHLGIPVYSGASLHGKPIDLREAPVLSEELYGLDRWIDGDIKKEMPFLRDSLYNIKEHVYGFDKAYEGLFGGMGSIAFDRIGNVYPLIVIGDKILPHLSLYAADKSIIQDEKLMVNGAKVPLTQKGGVIVNHRPVEKFYHVDHMRGMKNALVRARTNKTEDWVKEGDVVVILFNFYTGSTDFLEGAPFGNLPGGFLVSLMVDAVLENRWITPINGVSVLIFLMAVVGWILARTTGPVVYWVAKLSIGALYFALAIYLFAYENMMLSWIFPLCGLAGGGTIQYVCKRLTTEIQSVETQNQLLIERALRLEEEKTNLQLAERLNLGRAVQQILLPPLGISEHGPFKFAMSYTPNQEMSGDWIYVWGKDKPEKRIIIGDVVGKGPSAAIPVAILIGILGECERAEMSMEATFHHLNKRILELFERQITCSVSAIVINESLKIELYNAGSPGWFYRSDEKARHISLRSTTLGMADSAYIARETLELTPGSFLFTFTDGYMEGARAFKRLIMKLSTLDQQPELTDMQDILDEVGKSFRLEDDKSLLVVATKEVKRYKVVA